MNLDARRLGKLEAGAGSGKLEAGSWKREAGKREAGSGKREAWEREAGSGKREAGSGKREAGSWEREAGSGKLEAGSGKREAGSGKRESRPASAAATFGGIVIPLSLAVVYAVVLASNIVGAPGGFSSLQEVAELFSKRWLLLAGWVHYLAFDLFIGAWEVRDATERGVPRLLVAPCLVLTFLFGPIGLLCYHGVRLRRRLSRGCVAQGFSPATGKREAPAVACRAMSPSDKLWRASPERAVKWTRVSSGSWKLEAGSW